MCADVPRIFFILPAYAWLSINSQFHLNFDAFSVGWRMLTQITSCDTPIYIKRALRDIHLLEEDIRWTRIKNRTEVFQLEAIQWRWIAKEGTIFHYKEWWFNSRCSTRVFFSVLIYVCNVIEAKGEYTFNLNHTMFKYEILKKTPLIHIILTYFSKQNNGN